MNSSNEMVPLRSTSKRSNSLRHSVRKPHRPLCARCQSCLVCDSREKEGTHQNSSKDMVPLRSTSNMRIIILTVCGSKDV